MTQPFRPRGPADVTALVSAHPLAWIVSRDGGGLRATTLPVLAEAGADGAVTALVGHFARSNTHVEALRADPRCLVLVLGPHAYISPSWVRDRTWAPTWNFAHAQFEADLFFFEGADEIAAHLRELTGAMERERPGAWTPDEMGARFERLARGVIGFRARVVSSESRFKLGQDERPEILADILAALGETPIAALMRDVNGGRERAPD